MICIKVSVSRIPGYSIDAVAEQLWHLKPGRSHCTGRLKYRVLTTNGAFSPHAEHLTLSKLASNSLASASVVGIGGTGGSAVRFLQAKHSQVDPSLSLMYKERLTGGNCGSTYCSPVCVQNSLISVTACSVIRTSSSWKRSNSTSTCFSSSLAKASAAALSASASCRGRLGSGLAAAPDGASAPPMDIRKASASSGSMLSSSTSMGPLPVLPSSGLTGSGTSMVSNKHDTKSRFSLMAPSSAVPAANW
mmetsp:Transcript_48040/g.121089  ORF Transcript_48040/g.121089 Transcript_48040/m.121089 type:complete len:248 (-) Transcript_48040:265-1008(-)